MYGTAAAKYLEQNGCLQLQMKLGEHNLPQTLLKHRPLNGVLMWMEDPSTRTKWVSDFGGFPMLHIHNLHLLHAALEHFPTLRRRFSWSAIRCSRRKNEGKLCAAVLWIQDIDINIYEYNKYVFIVLLDYNKDYYSLIILFYN